MSSSKVTLLIVIATINLIAVSAFTVSRPQPPPPARIATQQHRSTLVLSVTTDPVTESDTTTVNESAEVEATDVTIPTNLPSACGMDYVPLASMLATGQLAEADQVRLPNETVFKMMI